MTGSFSFPCCAFSFKECFPRRVRAGFAFPCRSVALPNSPALSAVLARGLKVSDIKGGAKSEAEMRRASSIRQAHGAVTAGRVLFVPSFAGPTGRSGYRRGSAAFDVSVWRSGVR